MQLMAAPFPQMLLTSCATFIITYVLLRLFRVGDARIRSIFYMLTLVAPLVVYAVYTPSIWVMRPAMIRGFATEAGMVIERVEEIAGVNYTGLLCIIGLIFGVATLAISYIFGVSIVKRCQGVMDVTAEDEPRIYGTVARLARKMEVKTPRLGLTENLQPNAFTVGYGAKTMIVLSSGLISTLNQIELEAVIAHELAHVKNRDFHLMAAVSSLKVAAFFNPFAYLSASMLARERELLADEVGTKMTHRRNAFKRALVKISSVDVKSSVSILPSLVSGMFVYSQIGPLRAAFTSHPSLDTRLDRIGNNRVKTTLDGYKAALIAVILAASLAYLSVYIMQPMPLMGVFFRLDPSFGVHPMAFTEVGFGGGPDFMVFSGHIRGGGFTLIRRIPEALSLGKLVVY
jgi:heat shock protein HtpX